jgi:hypothetical protein
MVGRSEPADARVRALLAVVALGQAVTGVLFALQVPLVLGLWPFPMTAMSNVFIGSIFLAAAASTAWSLLVRSERALVGIALDYLTILIPFAVISAVVAVSDGALDVGAFAILCAVGAAIGVWFLRWALGHPWRTDRPTPRPVLVSFGIFIIGLVIGGTLLVLQVPGILPWRATPVVSTLFGFTFLGAAGYFVFGLLERRWENAGGQLAGFVAYDLVLVVPLLSELLGGGRGFYDTDDPVRLNLVIYALVVVYSLGLGIYYLAIHRGTRLQDIPEAERAVGPL